MEREAWIRDRILWMANQNHLPTERSAWYEEARETLPSPLVFGAEQTGIPVLVFFAGKTSWTILCTDKLISLDRGSIKELKFSEMRKFRMPQGDGPKSKIDIVLVQDRQDNLHEFPVACGVDFFGLSNLVVRLINMSRTPEQ